MSRRTNTARIITRGKRYVLNVGMWAARGLIPRQERRLPIPSHKFAPAVIDNGSKRNLACPSKCLLRFNLNLLISLQQA